jgi:hypothetical protein
MEHGEAMESIMSGRVPQAAGRHDEGPSSVQESQIDPHLRIIPLIELGSHLSK